jgi:hypothetical protein
MDNEFAPAPTPAADTGAPVDNGGALTPREAAALLFEGNRAENQARRPDEDEDSAPNAGRDPADEAAPRDDTDEPDPAAKPPIEPPRSWDRERKERFAALPPDLQEYIAEREQSRETEIRRSQNETAESRKASESERQRLEKARSDYEQALPALLNTLQQTTQAEFADIRSWDDVAKLAREDPLRYSEWDAHQKRTQAVQAQMRQAQQRQMSEAQERFSSYAEEQDAAILKRQPDLADPKTREKVQREAADYLVKDLGFAEEEIGRAWNGKATISIRDARWQSVIRDAVRYRASQKAVSTAVPAKPAVPVSRPGAAPSQGEVPAARVRELDKRLDSTGSAKDAFELWQARSKRK